MIIPLPARAAAPWIVSSGAFFAASLLLSLLAPPHLAGLLDGPDGTRWAGPFILWMGSCGALFLALVPLLRRSSTDPLDTLAMAALFFFAALILFVAGQRLTSGLRVNEGYNAAMSVWLSMGGSLYPDPELAPLGSIYGPLYFLLCAPLHLLFPGIPGIGRVISLAATATTAGILYLGGRRRVGAPWAGVWAAALFCATYSPMRQLYDMVNMDPLTMALCAGALYFFLARTDRGDMLALFFAACACFAKQTALPFFLIVLGGAIIARRKPWVYAPVLIASMAGAILLAATHGRAWDYMTQYPLHHHWGPLPDRGDLLRLFIVQLPSRPVQPLCRAPSLVPVQSRGPGGNSACQVNPRRGMAAVRRLPGAFGRQSHVGPVWRHRKPVLGGLRSAPAPAFGNNRAAVCADHTAKRRAGLPAAFTSGDQGRYRTAVPEIRNTCADRVLSGDRHNAIAKGLRGTTNRDIIIALATGGKRRRAVDTSSDFAPSYVRAHSAAHLSRRR
jgi:hypothetical protein